MIHTIPPSPQLPLLEAVCRQGVLVATSVRYWRGCKRLNPEDLGLDPSHVSDRLIQLGHKRLIPRDALQAFALIESRVQATVEGASFPFLGGIGRFVPNPRLGELKEKLDRLHDEFRAATLDFVAGFIDSFKSLNFAGDQQLEATLERFRRELLTRSAADYRNDGAAMTTLTDGLNRLRETAVQLARGDARDIVSRFGQLGARRLAAAS